MNNQQGMFIVLSASAGGTSDADNHAKAGKAWGQAGYLYPL